MNPQRQILSPPGDDEEVDTTGQEVEQDESGKTAGPQSPTGLQQDQDEQQSQQQGQKNQNENK